jgi:hypothetical protein
MNEIRQFLMKDHNGGILSSLSIFLLNTQTINQYLTLVISALTIIWLIKKIWFKQQD